MEKEVRTFNPGKKYSEDVLLHLIKSHSNASLTISFGANSIEESKQYSFNQRMMNRLNGLKERITLQISLINEIAGTIAISGSKDDKVMLKVIMKNLKMLKENFEERKDEILIIEVIQGVKKPQLTKKFDEINNYLDDLYPRISSVMTRNKLLFVSESDSFSEDQVLKDKIKSRNLEA